MKDKLAFPPGLAPGIYFRLPENVYHLDAALGSTDIRGIVADPQQWWKGSKLNPNAEERKAYRNITKATVLGSAMHKMVLEGFDAFKRVYVRRPDDPKGASAAEKGALTKASNAKLLQGQWQLHGKEWDIVMRTEQLIRSHPDLAQSLSGGQNEVSVFWERPDGVRCKCRFDRLKPHGIGDLKSIENEKRRRLEDAALADIGWYGYDIQAAHYLEGRAQMKALFGAGKVFVVNVHRDIEDAFTSTMPFAGVCCDFAAECAATETHRRIKTPDGQLEVEWSGGDYDNRYQFIFIFVQKSAPGVWAGVLAVEENILAEAHYDIERAIGVYVKNAAATEPGKPWGPAWRLRHISDGDLPIGYRKNRWKD